VIYDSYSIEPSPDSAHVRLHVWPEQSRGAVEVARRFIEALQSPRHFRQPHGLPFALDSAPVPPQTTSTRQFNSRTAAFMKDQLSSLITPNAQAGLALAGKLAEELHAQLDRAIPQWNGPAA
jgi:hypothetical protein